MLFLTCIGVTLHFVSSTHKLQKVVLDLIYFPPPHTGTEVAKLTTSVFKEWDIQVPIIITDNGSNIDVQVSPSETDFHQEEDRQTLFLTDPDLNIETEESTIELENEEVEYKIFETQCK